MKALTGNRDTWYLHKEEEGKVLKYSMTLLMLYWSTYEVSLCSLHVSLELGLRGSWLTLFVSCQHNILSHEAPFFQTFLVNMFTTSAYLRFFILVKHIIYKLFFPKQIYPFRESVNIIVRENVIIININIIINVDLWDNM